MPTALLDTNVLVHAAGVTARFHAAAAELVDRGLRQRDRYCIAPQNLVEFAAVVTKPRVVQKPMSPSEMSRMADILYRSRRLTKIYPQRATVMRAIRQGDALSINGPLWYDLFLAATMRDAGVRRIITDNTADFDRFPFVTAVRIEDAV